MQEVKRHTIGGQVKKTIKEMSRQADTKCQGETVVKNQADQKQNPGSWIPREPSRAEQENQDGEFQHIRELALDRKLESFRQVPSQQDSLNLNQLRSTEIKLDELKMVII